MTELQTHRATVADLQQEEGKVELVRGRIVRYPMAGDRHNEVAANVYSSLRAFAKRTRVGIARTDGLDYHVPELPSGRETFRPDCSYHRGRRPDNPMGVIPAAPTFAVEVRSPEDYGPVAESRLAAKRADYFEAGTEVVWDVDTRNETVVVYRRGDPANPTVYRRGQTANADPAAPGWTMTVDEVFE